DVRLDGELTPTAIDQDHEGDTTRPTKVGQLVQRGAHGAAGVQHVVDDDDVLALDIDGNPRLPHERSRPNRLQVVAIERDVERPLRDARLVALGDARHETRRELDTAALNSDNDETIRSVVQLDDLVGHTPERSIDGSGVENRMFCRHGGRKYARASWQAKADARVRGE